MGELVYVSWRLRKSVQLFIYDTPVDTKAHNRYCWRMPRSLPKSVGLLFSVGKMQTQAMCVQLECTITSPLADVSKYQP